MCGSSVTCPRDTRIHGMSPPVPSRPPLQVQPGGLPDQRMGSGGRPLTLDTHTGWVVLVFLCGTGSYWPGPIHPNPFAMCSRLTTFSMEDHTPRAAHITLFATPLDAADAWHSRPRPTLGSFVLRHWPPACSVQAWNIALIHDRSAAPSLTTSTWPQNLTHWDPAGTDPGPWLIAGASHPARGRARAHHESPGSPFTPGPAPRPLPPHHVEQDDL